MAHHVQLMGILNITPDSFSDGGCFLAKEDALTQAQKMKNEGADIIDVGAESTRPGHQAISVDEEIARLSPVLPSIVALGLPVSIDTTKHQVAAYALKAGVTFVNDIWGLQGDPKLAEIVASYNAKIVVMHNRAQIDPQIDIIEDMKIFFDRSLSIAHQHHIKSEMIILDPGIGFGKSFEQNLMAIKHLDMLQHYQLPILVGASRKSFIGKIIESQPQQRLAGSLAAHLLCVQNGATFLRVHDVAQMRQALAVSAAIKDAV